MGDISDGMIDGTFDCISGEYLGEGPGYPRTADGSLPWERRRSKAQKTNQAPTFEAANYNQRQTAIGRVCNVLTEMSVKGKGTRRKTLRDFLGLNAFKISYQGDLHQADLPLYCWLIYNYPGGIGMLRKYITELKTENKNESN